ncbi:MAG: SAM-dependent chlorinase/fluorinase [Ignisphaera sp.]
MLHPNASIITSNKLYPRTCGVIAILTDFGLEDPYVATMKAIAIGICPEAKILDIVHTVSSFDIESAALILYMVYRYFPKGTVFVAIVDPGVGSSRRAIAIATQNYILIGPDNGVLMPAAKDDGIVETRLLENEYYFRKPISKSFHGRDIFMPVAAHIVCGAKFENLGRSIDKESLIEPDIGLGFLRIIDNCVQLKVVHVDKFGNLMLSTQFNKLKQLLDLNIGSTANIYSQERKFAAKVEETFSIAPKGTLVLYENSFGLAELAVNKGSAKDLLGISKGSMVTVCRS